MDASGWKLSTSPSTFLHSNQTNGSSNRGHYMKPTKSWICLRCLEQVKIIFPKGGWIKIYHGTKLKHALNKSNKQCTIPRQNSKIIKLPYSFIVWSPPKRRFKDPSVQSDLWFTNQQTTCVRIWDNSKRHAFGTLPKLLNRNIPSRWKWMIGRQVSFWETLFSGAVSVWVRVFGTNKKAEQTITLQGTSPSPTWGTGK